MSDQQDEINKLTDRLEALLKRQEDFLREIDILRIEIDKLKGPEIQQAPETGNKPAATMSFDEGKAKTTGSISSQKQLKPLPANWDFPAKPRKTKSDIEKFIGENLINKIGIAITIVGVGIGAKYTIDNQLIGPLTRIILGYLVGIGLLGFAIKLKKKYEDFSAVLLSGSMAIMYFITFSAYSFYGLIPQLLAFMLMVIFTAFTVMAALTYNKQLIAHIGLVGAYAVPFLLSDGSGNVATLFTYMAIINGGILAIAFKKYWKPLYYSSFGLTWLIYLSWYLFNYRLEDQFELALGFLSIFFAIFYLTFLSYKLLRKETFQVNDIILLLANSFIFYGIGYATLEDHNTGHHLLGVFTLCNAIIHFFVSFVIYHQKLADRNLLYLVAGLVLVFITITIPVQLDGNWVSLLWVGEAALLFWIGRTKSIPIYEKVSHPLMVLAFFSLLHDWSLGYNAYNSENIEVWTPPLFNIYFLTSALFISTFGFINILNRSKKYPPAWQPQHSLFKLVSFALPSILLFTIYYAFRFEISYYWNQLYIASQAISPPEDREIFLQFGNTDLLRFETIWIINYSLLFVSLLAFVNFKKWKSKPLEWVSLGLIAIAVLAFLTTGLFELSELRESHLEQTFSFYGQSGIFNLVIRYISFAFVALPFLSAYKYTLLHQDRADVKIAFDLLLHTTVLWTACSELIHWMDIAESTQSYKLGLSILGGIYALFLIVLGIWEKKKHLRIGAITLFGLTLVKLFFYDISHLDTIAKIIVFLSLGVLLLIISFLYNKYKHIISDEKVH
ncbi:DUF2339 domain-containing protein [Negadavirga shengliensis]|uniref:DUF2339 domain-containing protein n=1 Tax=Negadavirga shengliensis TaxID=1389218 RepID=A0ABV9SWB9_9BACT